jgi:ketosteroid isomerase-like protein
MKKNIFAILFAMLAITACKQAPAPVVVDLETEKAVIDSVFDKFTTAFMERDVAALASLLNEDALCLGTDPSEFLSKQQITEMWSQMLADSAIEIINISERKIKVAADGNSATVVDQYMMPAISSKIPWRNAYHLVKTNDKWRIDFLNCALIPKNEDLPKLNQALE